MRYRVHRRGGSGGDRERSADGGVVRTNGGKEDVGSGDAAPAAGVPNVGGGVVMVLAIDANTSVDAKRREELA